MLGRVVGEGALSDASPSGDGSPVPPQVSRCVICTKLLVTDRGDVKIFGFGASYVRELDRSNIVRADMHEDFAAPECIAIPDGIRHNHRF
jgi:hypothetical protein